MVIIAHPFFQRRHHFLRIILEELKRSLLFCRQYKAVQERLEKVQILIENLLEKVQKI